MCVCVYWVVSIHTYTHNWRSERACASAATIRSSKWKSAMDIWYVQLYFVGLAACDTGKHSLFAHNFSTFKAPSGNLEKVKNSLIYGPRPL